MKSQTGVMGVLVVFVIILARHCSFGKSRETSKQAITFIKSTTSQNIRSQKSGMTFRDVMLDAQDPGF